MKTGLKFVLTFILLAGYSCSSSSKKKDLPDVDKPQVTDKTNAVSNYNFEEDVDLTKVAQAVAKKWSYLGGWNDTKAKVEQMSNKGVNNSRCLAIIALEQDVDVAVAQKITGLTPGVPYKITARVKTENVTNGKGAHLSLDYLWAPTSESVMGTKEWTTVSLEVDDVPKSGEITVCLRLGNTANAAKGVAYFDNIVAKENTDLYVRESQHVKLMINKDKVSVSDAAIGNWLSDLDKVYEKYVELFSGRFPFEGRKMFIRQKENVGYWAGAGEPIGWNSNYIASELSSLNKGNWSFGIMHELGHNFAPYFAGGNYSWNWNEELFANFRMFYALDKLNGKVVIETSVPDGTGGYRRVERTFVGDEIKTMYKSETDYSYDRTLGANSSASNGDGVCWTLIRIKEKYGWNVFIKAFDDIYKLPKNENEEKNWTGWQKFEYFLSFLSKHAGEDVHNTYTSQELNLIRISLGG